MSSPTRPTAAFAGTDTFVVNVSDGATPTAGTDTETITVTILDAAPPVLADNAAGTLTLSGAGGDVDFTDNVTVRTDAVITGFAAGDEILVDHPNRCRLQWLARHTATLPDSVAGGAALTTSSSPTTRAETSRRSCWWMRLSTRMGESNFVFDYASAKASMGFDFITIV